MGWIPAAALCHGGSRSDLRGSGTRARLSDRRGSAGPPHFAPSSRLAPPEAPVVSRGGPSSRSTRRRGADLPATRAARLPLLESSRHSSFRIASGAARSPYPPFSTFPVLLSPAITGSRSTPDASTELTILFTQGLARVLRFTHVHSGVAAARRSSHALALRVPRTRATERTPRGVRPPEGTWQKIGEGFRTTRGAPDRGRLPASGAGRLLGQDAGRDDGCGTQRPDTSRSR